MKVRVAISACALAASASVLMPPATSFAAAAAPAWPQSQSDVQPDPAVRFGVLPNGMRYAIQKNATPIAQVSLRLRFDTGSLEEQDTQLGLAHFLEHMAFRGSAKVPTGEVEKSLERLGLKMGADTNASTSETQTIYQFDLAKNDAVSLDTGLMMLRETGDALTLDAKAFDAERGVVMSELRLRNTPALHMSIAQQDFLLKDQLVTKRIPIGSNEILQNAPVTLVRDYYRSWYRPERATLIVAGDVDVDNIESRIKTGFGDWKAMGAAANEPNLGAPLPRAAAAQVFSEAGAPSVTLVAWVRPFDSAPDTVAREKRDLIRLVGAAILNRRFQAAAAAADRKFTQGGVATQPLSRSAEVTTMFVAHEVGGWRAALLAAEQLRRQAVEQGVQQAEVDREVANLRTQMQAMASAANTRRSPQLAAALLETVESNGVYTSPAQDVAAVDAALQGLSAATVSAALREQFNGNGPLAFVSSPNAVAGGDAAVLAALNEAEGAKLVAATVTKDEIWPYTNFGKTGVVTEQKRVDDLDVTQVQFANGVRLTIKPTKFSADQVLVNVYVRNGRLDLPKNHLTSAWAANYGAVVAGGVGKLDFQAMQRVLTGKVYRVNFQIGDNSFIFGGQTRPADLSTQLQVLAAYVSDPALRSEAFEQVRSGIQPQLAQVAANPLALFQVSSGGLLHAGDPRWAFPAAADVQAAKGEEFKRLLAPALARGAIEITVVGDITVEQATAAVAATFGALPKRTAPIIKAMASDVRFPAPTNTPVVLVHKGTAEQGIAAAAWPTTDAFADLRANAARQLLASIVQDRLKDQLRELAGTSYTVQMQGQSSQVFPGFGVLFAFADIPPAKSALFFDGLKKIVSDLRSSPPTADELERARNPALANLKQAQQSNQYWLGTLGQMQSEPRVAELVRQSATNLQGVTAADVQRAATTWLVDGKAWKLLVQAAP
jgi:zinc protease